MTERGGRGREGLQLQYMYMYTYTSCRKRRPTKMFKIVSHSYFLHKLGHFFSSLHWVLLSDSLIYCYLIFSNAYAHNHVCIAWSSFTRPAFCYTLQWNVEGSIEEYWGGLPFLCPWWRLMNRMNLVYCPAKREGLCDHLKFLEGDGQCLCTLCVCLRMVPSFSDVELISTCAYVYTCNTNCCECFSYLSYTHTHCYITSRKVENWNRK